MKRIIPFAHEILKDHINQESIVVDATMGNGHDTVFLANIAKKVYAFDIQKQAIESTKVLLKSHALTNVQLIHDSHQNLFVYVAPYVDAIIFNLGYLPGASKTVTTNKASTLDAVKQSLALLKNGGILSITFYSNHSEGKEEIDALIPYLKALSSYHFEVLQYHFINKVESPFNVFVKKLRE